MLRLERQSKMNLARWVDYMVEFGVDNLIPIENSNLDIFCIFVASVTFLLFVFAQLMRRCFHCGKK
jgi:hypothetical protein